MAEIAPPQTHTAYTRRRTLVPPFLSARNRHCACRYVWRLINAVRLKFRNVNGEKAVTPLLGKLEVFGIPLRLVLLVLAAESLSLMAQVPTEPRPTPDRELRVDFLKKSGPQLVSEYFQGPPYPLFVILRLIELGDPAVVPDLERAFEIEAYNPTREFIAAALVSLGDKQSRYFDYVARYAGIAVASDLPFPVQLGTDRSSSPGLPPITAAFTSWIECHGGIHIHQ